MQAKYIGKNRLYFSKLESTNAKAKEITSRENLQEGTLIWTHEQQAGRGYAQNTWESEHYKNITASFVLYPTFMKPDKQFWLTRVLSLAVKDFTAYFLPQNCAISIKWPNDIYVNDKKIAGILVENSIQAQHIKNSVAGIGININQLKFISDAPNPTSVFLESGIENSIEFCYDILSYSIEQWYNKLKMGDFGHIDQIYTQSLYRFQTLSWYEANNKRFSGSITGTDSIGRLKILSADNTELVFDFKEIRFVI